MWFDDGLSANRLRASNVAAIDDARKLRRVIAKPNESGLKEFKNNLAFAAISHGVVGGGDIGAEVMFCE